MRNQDLANTILRPMADFNANGQFVVSASQLCAQLSQSRPTVNRYLESMVLVGDLLRVGKGPATRYQLTKMVRPQAAMTPDFTSPDWSDTAIALRASL